MIRRYLCDTMNYWKYTLHTPPETADILLAYLSEGDFDTFEEHEGGLHAYLPARADQEAAEQQLRDLQNQFLFEWEKDFIPAQNWNEVWESNFQPVIVGDFCAVRADFHAPVSGVRHELVINPKMAFGTGHHETTWMCLAAMEFLPMAGMNLLDYGCGTGILAIMAAKLGAAHVEAVDIEEESCRNTQENCANNEIRHVNVRCGDIHAVQGREFDGILANINRHIILASLDQLAAYSKPGAWLLVSGILLSDEKIVVAAAAAVGFELDSLNQKGNWLCIRFLKVN